MTEEHELKRITVVGDDRPGTLAEVTEVLSSMDIDIRDITTRVVGEDAFLTLIVSDYDRSLSALISAGFNAIAEESVLVRIEDQPGALAAIARRLADEGIDIRGISMVHQRAEHSAIAISSDNDARVRQLFADQLFN